MTTHVAGLVAVVPSLAWTTLSGGTGDFTNRQSADYPRLAHAEDMGIEPDGPTRGSRRRDPSD